MMLIIESAWYDAKTEQHFQKKKNQNIFNTFYFGLFIILVQIF